MKYELYPPEAPNMGKLFVNHQATGRSGHLSHALLEYRKGCVLAFYSNCSGKRNRWAPGHNGFGWLEFKRSTDYGETWDNGTVLDYSMQCLLNEPFTVSCEKAVSPAEDEIVALCIRNENPNGWEPYLEPVVLRSEDGGHTWSDAVPFCNCKGRIYDALVVDGVIYVLMLAHNDFLTNGPDQRYQLYVSLDHGRSFQLRSELPGDYLAHAYGSLVFREDGSLMAYTYNANDEYNLDCFISHDQGRTWPERVQSYCAKRIRNPQVAKVRGGYILHGRSGCVQPDLPMDFVLYTSEDGLRWDEGRFLCSVPGSTAYYSNNLVMEMPDGSERVLIQASVPYDKGRVNIAHWVMTIR